MKLRAGLLTALLTSLVAVLGLASVPGSQAAAPRVTKVLVFVEENHSLAQMRSGMPYTFGLATTYGYATSYTATRHPSLPNYLAIAGGRTFGVADDKAPSEHPLAGRSAFRAAILAGRTARTYAESMPANCTLTPSGQYAVKHNPWAYFAWSGERADCRKFDLPETRLAGDITNGRLPTVGMVVPNLCHDAHNCSLATADAWFKSRMQRIFAGPDWKAGRLAVVLTADEDDSASGNQVLTVVIHPSQHGHVVTTPLTHYSMTRLYNDVAHTKRLGAAATAPSLSAAFGLPLG
jgi:Phosphoesterase family